MPKAMAIPGKRTDFERTKRFRRLMDRAKRVFDSEVEARHFMFTAHPELGCSPFAATKTDTGARLVDDLLYDIEKGLA